ncbi:MAG TPA: CheR family methyltransferase [Anaeromyxobacteraceae bacterium]|nr:CheR family methyltransferase [Anaeromyxobacteraceae bacterium]
MPSWGGQGAGERLAGAMAEVGGAWEALRQATGRDLSVYRPAAVARALARRMSAGDLASLDAYLERLQRDPAEARALIEELSVGVTSFFRDEEVFAFLERRILPRLAAEARASGILRAWVPGCASGEEAYTVAILLREAAERAGDGRAVVFATDVDGAALALARRARYPREAAERVGPGRLARFFDVHADEAVARQDLRDACVFAAHDLARDPPFTRVDLVCCRNVLIYFDDEARKATVSLLHQALRPGGVLVLGSSEGLVPDLALFEPVEARLRIFTRREGAAVPQRFRPARHLHPAPAMDSPPAAEGRAVSSFEHLLLREVAPACAVVDAHGTVLHFSGPVGRYVEPQGALSTDIVELARDAVRLEVRSALQRAVAERRTVTEETGIVRVGDRSELVEVVARPLPGSEQEGDRYLIVFREVRVVGASAAEPGDDPLRAELGTTRRRLRAVVDELQVSNAEHRVAHEKLRALNDELQTSHEELESLNEELQTVNGELARKVEELDRAHGDLQNLFRSTDVAVLFLGTDLAIKKFTPAATRLFPLIEADVGRRITDISARFPAADLASDVEAALRAHAVRERQIRVDGTGRWYALRVLPYATLAGATDGVVVTFADITEAKQAEATSRASETRLREIVDTVPHLVWTATADGRRDYFSRQWREYTGLSAGPQLDQGWIEAYHPDDRGPMVDAWREAARTGRPFQAEYRIRRHDGVYRWFKARANPLRDAAGQVERWIGTSTDVDELKRLEASLRDAAVKKDAFMALLGHELRNPLAPVGNALDLLRQRSDPEHVMRAVDVIDRQVKHLTRLVDDLLDISRITRGKIQLRAERMDLAALVRSLLDDHRPLFAAAGIELQAEVPRVPLWMNGDPARLAQMVGNLLQNAKKFTDRGGSVTVAMAVTGDGRRATVRVRDTGIGMEPASIEQMFDAFSQADATLARSRGGLGLGLALVKALAELHGGSVRGASEGLGRGAEFELTLPLAEAPGQALQEPAGAAGRRILLVDDNVDAVETLAELLRLEGYEVRVATDGAGALAEARRFAPEVVVCDIGLPGELDGYGVARGVRGDPALAHTGLIAMTGYATEEDQRRSREAGFAVHLSKPARIDAVTRAIDALGRGGVSPGTPRSR